MNIGYKLIFSTKLKEHVALWFYVDLFEFCVENHHTDNKLEKKNPNALNFYKQREYFFYGIVNIGSIKTIFFENQKKANALNFF